MTRIVQPVSNTSLPLSGSAMDFPTSHEGATQAPSSHGTQDTQPGSSTANLTEEDLIGVGSSGWKLDEVMDAR